MEHHIRIRFSLYQGPRGVFGSLGYSLSSPLGLSVAGRRSSSPGMDSWAWCRGHGDKEATVALALRAAVVSEVPRSRNLTIGNGVKRTCVLRPRLRSKPSSFLTDWGSPARGRWRLWSGGCFLGRPGLGSGNQSLMNLVTITNTGEKENWKEKDSARDWGDKTKRKNTGSKTTANTREE